MSRNKEFAGSADFDRARDELFSHIHRCGVLGATQEQQTEWMDDTVEYLGERYPELGREQLDEIKAIGMRFCRPVIDRVTHDSEAETQGEEKATADEPVAA